MNADGDCDWRLQDASSWTDHHCFAEGDKTATYQIRFFQCGLFKPHTVMFTLLQAGESSVASALFIIFSWKKNERQQRRQTLPARRWERTLTTIKRGRRGLSLKSAIPRVNSPFFISCSASPSGRAVGLTIYWTTSTSQKSYTRTPSLLHIFPWGLVGDKLLQDVTHMLTCNIWFPARHALLKIYISWFRIGTPFVL